MSIYVEISIRGALCDLWRLTQKPKLHEGWDLRFTSKEYLERADGSPIRLFRYAARIGFDGGSLRAWFSLLRPLQLALAADNLVDGGGTVRRASCHFGIEVNVTNMNWGPLFGYGGAFDIEWLRRRTAHRTVPSRDASSGGRSLQTETAGGAV